MKRNHFGNAHRARRRKAAEHQFPTNSLKSINGVVVRVVRVTDDQIVVRSIMTANEYKLPVGQMV